MAAEEVRRVRKVVLPVAGLGTRFLPVTKVIPKEMLPIVDVPSIQLIVEECVASGIEEVVLVTARGKSALEDQKDKIDGLIKLEKVYRNEFENSLKKIQDLGKATIAYQTIRLSARATPGIERTRWT